MKRLACLTVVLTWTTTARADLVLAFTPNATPITFSVVVGSTVNVPVYLVERNQAPITNILSTEGLFSAGVRLNYNNTAGSATVITNGALLNPGFDTNSNGFPIINNTAGFAAVSGATTDFGGVPASGNPAFVLVGTFTFQGNQIGNVTTISTAKPQALAFPEFLSNTTGTVLELEPYGNIFFAAGNPNNPISYSTTITTVAAVPEPTTYVLVALGTLLVLAATYLWRVRQRRAVEQIVDLPEEVAIQA
jgi:hypothetical protein